MLCVRNTVFFQAYKNKITQKTQYVAPTTSSSNNREQFQCIFRFLRHREASKPVKWTKCFDTPLPVHFHKFCTVGSSVIPFMRRLSSETLVQNLFLVYIKRLLSFSPAKCCCCLQNQRERCSASFLCKDECAMKHIVAYCSFYHENANSCIFCVLSVTYTMLFLALLRRIAFPLPGRIH